MITLQADALALGLLVHDIALLDPLEQSLPTPCPGWAVADLLRHLSDQHRAILAPLGVTVPVTGDLRGDAAVVAAVWIAALRDAPDAVQVPKMGRAAPTQELLAVHAVDMIVHRWDLAQALGRSAELLVPEDLLGFALSVAARITAPGSPLNGPGGVYAPPGPVLPNSPPLDRLVAALGRDPQWVRPALP